MEASLVRLGIPERIGKYMVAHDRLGDVVDGVADFTDDLVVCDIGIPPGANVFADGVFTGRTDQRIAC